MSSIFTKSTGISSLASVLSTSSNSNGPNKAGQQQNHQQPQVKNAVINAKAPHSFASNNYLKTIDNCLEEASRTGELLLTNKSLIEFPSTIAFKYDLTDTLSVGK